LITRYKRDAFFVLKRNSYEDRYHWVSVGIEDFEDIKSDFEQAIERAFEVKK